MTDVDCFNLGTEMKINSNCNSISYIAKLVRFPFPAFRFPFPICCFPFPSPHSAYAVLNWSTLCMEKSEQSFQHFKWQRKRKQQQKSEKEKRKKKRENKTDAEKNSIIWATCVHAWILIGNFIIQFSINAHKLISAHRERRRWSERVEGIEREGDRCRYIFQSHTHLQEY